MHKTASGRTEIAERAAAGAANLLDDCLRVAPGDSLLIVVEPEPSRYYDPAVAPLIAEEAQARGVEVRLLALPLADGPDAAPAALAPAMEGATHTVFCSRLGDQLRFRDLGTGRRVVMCYALDLALLGAPFGTTSWSLFSDIHDWLFDRIRSASRYRLTCPLGTDLGGVVPSAMTFIAGFGVTPFPLLIWPPMPVEALDGQVVFDEYLMSTSLDRYAGSDLALPEPVTARVSGGRITGFDGAPALVAAVEAQYERVGALSGGDPWRVNSWHTGMYPHTFYADDPAEHVQRWGDLAFGSPRYTHFHTCGPAPGNVCGSTFDATIEFDGVRYWDAGKPVFLDLDGPRELLAAHGCGVEAFALRRDIGLRNRD